MKTFSCTANPTGSSMMYIRYAKLLDW